MNRTVGTAAVTLIAASVIALSACSGPTKQSHDLQSVGVQDSEVSGQSQLPTKAMANTKACLVSGITATDDTSFNQAAQTSLELLANETGIQFEVMDAANPAKVDSEISQLISADCNLVIGIGKSMATSFESAAKNNSGIDFVLVNGEFANPSSNSKSLLFEVEEPAYLAGYAAAGMTATGMIGVYMGEVTQTTIKLANGFSGGVAKYNEVNGTAIKILGWDSDNQKGTVIASFSDVEKAKEVTQQLIDGGADIIFPLAGDAGVGTLEKAQENVGTLVIWNGSDGYESQSNYTNLILTSVTENIKNAFREAIYEMNDGNFDSTSYLGNLENEGVSLAPWHEFDELIPVDLKEQIDNLHQEIIKGTVKISKE